MIDWFSHLGFVFIENVNVDIRGDFSIAMTEVLGNCLNIVAVIDKQAGVTVSESVNALSAWKSEKWNHLWWWSPSRAWMKSSHSSDEVRGQASDRIKSATRRSRISSRSDFIHLWWIYSATGRFHCTTVHRRDKTKMPNRGWAFFVFDQRSKLSLRVLRIPFDIVNNVKYRVIS